MHFFFILTTTGNTCLTFPYTERHNYLTYDFTTFCTHHSLSLSSILYPSLSLSLLFSVYLFLNSSCFCLSLSRSLSFFYLFLYFVSSLVFTPAVKLINLLAGLSCFRAWSNCRLTNHLIEQHFVVDTADKNLKYLLMIICTLVYNVTCE